MKIVCTLRLPLSLFQQTQNTQIKNVIQILTFTLQSYDFGVQQTLQSLFLSSHTFRWGDNLQLSLHAYALKGKHGFKNFSCPRLGDEVKATHHEWRGVFIETHYQWRGVLIKTHYQWRGVLMKTHYQWRGVLIKPHYQWRGVLIKTHYEWRAVLIKTHYEWRGVLFMVVKKMVGTADAQKSP
jgi:hypothetical protein